LEMAQGKQKSTSKRTESYIWSLIPFRSRRLLDSSRSLGIAILSFSKITMANGVMQESFFKESPADEQGDVILSVEACHYLVNQAVARLGRIRVKGEVVQVKPRGAAVYVDLKDANGKDFLINCVIFQWQAQKFFHLLEVGFEVVVVGRAELYKKGTFNLKIDEVKPSGEGAWKKEFEALKKRLGGKGYFDESRKRPIPPFVQKIGVITSEADKALSDFRKNLGNYGFQVFLYDVWVEGDKAEKSIVEAFQWFQKNRPDMDVLVLIRGGGSSENLVVFHSEKIADEIVSSRIPVITGIGHETDESIADYVADKWLNAPTAVGAFLTTEREKLVRNVDTLWEDLKEKTETLLQEHTLVLNTQSRELALAVERMLEKYRFSVAQATEKLHRGFGRVFEAFASVRQRLVRARYTYEQIVYSYISRVEKAAVALSSLNPENVLQRGYGVVYTLGDGSGQAKERKVLKNVAEVKVGEPVAVRLWKGKFISRVERTEE